jgi:hypothetical protein
VPFVFSPRDPAKRGRGPKTRTAQISHDKHQQKTLSEIKEMQKNIMK